MTKLYIFEGPDGAGKTTTVEHLAKSYELAGQTVGIVHLDYNPDLDLQWFEARQTVDGGYYDVVIMDRSPESELCYGPVLRDGIRGTADQWSEWYQWSRRANAEKILLLDKAESLVDRAFDRGESYLSRTQLREVIDLYQYRIGTAVDWKELFGIPAQNSWLIAKQREIWV
jgi:thymidylate kinase